MKIFNKIKYFINRNWLTLTTIAFIIFITTFRFSISKSGHLFWEDELRYLNSIVAIQIFKTCNFKAAIDVFFNAHARPGYILISLIPAGLQLLALKYNIFSLWNPEFFEALHHSKIPLKFNPEVFNIPSFFNLLAISGCMFFFYKILNLLIKDKKWALLGTIVFSLLTNTNFYIRQMVPYSYSLFFFLWAVYWVLNEAEKKLKPKSVFLIGLISAFAFSIYPAYYLFIVIIGFMILYLTRDILLTMLYGAGLGLFTAIMEGLSRINGHSYLNSCRDLSALVTQGDFNQGFSFPFHYLYEVEGLIGAVIAILFLLFVFMFLPRSSKPIKSLFVIFLIGYLYHATMCVFFKKMVYYGRILHMYYPFFVIGAILAVKKIPSTLIKRVAIGILLLTSLISFKSFAQRFATLNYPLDFQQHYIRNLPPELICYTHDYKQVNLRKLDFSAAVVVNAMSLHPINDFKIPFNPPEEFALLASVPHPIMFKAYQYEGHSTRDREILKTRSLTMDIYVRKIFGVRPQ